MQPLEGDPGMKTMPQKCTASRMFSKNRNDILKLSGKCEKQVFYEIQEGTFRGP